MAGPAHRHEFVTVEQSIRVTAQRHAVMNLLRYHHHALRSVPIERVFTQWMLSQVELGQTSPSLC
jgi:Fe2+ or Zn2+ uptake regulation protein